MKTFTSVQHGQVCCLFSMFWYNFPCLDKTFHAMPHENLDPRLCHGRRPVRSAGLARCLWSQRCRAQDRVWTKKWFKNMFSSKVYKKQCVSLFWPKARVLLTCITIDTSFVPASMWNLAWRWFFLAEQIKNAFQRTTIVCSIYSSTKSAYFACNYRACWIFIFTFCEVLFVDCQIWYLETFSLIWSKRNMHQEKFTTKPTVFSPQNL